MKDQVAVPIGVRRILGPTILMGDGAYFDYEAPEASPITIEDVAFGLAYTARFRGQTRALREDGQRCFYSVAEHCVRMSQAMLSAGCGDRLALAGLMHELGEVPLGDLPSPAKMMLPAFKVLEKRLEAAMWQQFELPSLSDDDVAIIKHFDLRMLATEKRDLMTGAIPGDHWEMLGGFEPIASMSITPYRHPDLAADAFLNLWSHFNG
ncbi:hypothetical protein [Sphingobium sp. YG1]|uniref:hypothetical protein n=1 Tax=Sphingobium sp. YG1 TaxID=2082188 RepID=UPI000DBB809F|nr:hypothetical protein [Sphingobium sp. YG1]BBD01857.1 hypothetical protein YGS_C1P3112 [Sphingobium sp. YG1]